MAQQADVRGAFRAGTRRIWMCLSSLHAGPGVDEAFQYALHDLCEMSEWEREPQAGMVAW